MGLGKASVREAGQALGPQAWVERSWEATVSHSRISSWQGGQPGQCPPSLCLRAPGGSWERGRYSVSSGGLLGPQVTGPRGDKAGLQLPGIREVLQVSPGKYRCMTLCKASV